MFNFISIFCVNQANKADRKRKQLRSKAGNRWRAISRFFAKLAYSEVEDLDNLDYVRCKAGVGAGALPASGFKKESVATIKNIKR